MYKKISLLKFKIYYDKHLFLFYFDILNYYLYKKCKIFKINALK